MQPRRNQSLFDLHELFVEFEDATIAFETARTSLGVQICSMIGLVIGQVDSRPGRPLWGLIPWAAPSGLKDRNNRIDLDKPEQTIKKR